MSPAGTGSNKLTGPGWKADPINLWWLLLGIPVLVLGRWLDRRYYRG